MYYLLQQTCTIHYDGGGGLYLIPVALILEDHPPAAILLNGSRIVSPNESLSQIPLQFLVDGKNFHVCLATKRHTACFLGFLRGIR